MYQPIAINKTEIGTLVLDPIMDRPTAPHCADCGETLAIDRCLNADCVTAAARASSVTLSAPRAWTLGGRVD